MKINREDLLPDLEIPEGFEGSGGLLPDEDDEELDTDALLEEVIEGVDPEEELTTGEIAVHTVDPVEEEMEEAAKAVGSKKAAKTPSTRKRGQSRIKDLKGVVEKLKNGTYEWDKLGLGTDRSKVKSTLVNENKSTKGHWAASASFLHPENGGTQELFDMIDWTPGTKQGDVKEKRKEALKEDLERSGKPGGAIDALMTGADLRDAQIDILKGFINKLEEFTNDPELKAVWDRLSKEMVSVETSEERKKSEEERAAIMAAGDKESKATPEELKIAESKMAKKVEPTRKNGEPAKKVEPPSSGGKEPPKEPEEEEITDYGIGDEEDKAALFLDSKPDPATIAQVLTKNPSLIEPVIIKLVQQGSNEAIGKVWSILAKKDPSLSARVVNTIKGEKTKKVEEKAADEAKAAADDIKRAEQEAAHREKLKQRMEEAKRKQEEENAELEKDYAKEKGHERTANVLKMLIPILTGGEDYNVSPYIREQNMKQSPLKVLHDIVERKYMNPRHERVVKAIMATENQLMRVFSGIPDQKYRARLIVDATRTLDTTRRVMEQMIEKYNFDPTPAYIRAYMGNIEEQYMGYADDPDAFEGGTAS